MVTAPLSTFGKVQIVLPAIKKSLNETCGYFWMLDEKQALLKTGILKKILFELSAPYNGVLTVYIHLKYLYFFSAACLPSFILSLGSCIVKEKKFFDHSEETVPATQSCGG